MHRRCGPGLGVGRVSAFRALSRSRFSMDSTFEFSPLPVVRFGVGENDKDILTSEYSFGLATNFRPNPDYMADVRSMHRPFGILIGQNDEVYYPDRFAEPLRQAGKDVPVTIIPAVDHIHLILTPIAFERAVEAIKNLHSGR